MNVSTLHNSTQKFEPAYTMTKLKTVLGKRIYLQIDNDGTKSYVMQGIKRVLKYNPQLRQCKFVKVKSWIHINQLDHDALFLEYPERFKQYRQSLLNRR